MIILRRLILAISFQMGRAIAQWQRLFQRRERSPRRPSHVPPNPRWRQLRSQAGFVLPTTALLLVVVALTVTALSLRTLNRTEQVAADRAQKVIYNAATPAIDRAKAKLELLFTADPRLIAGGIPSEKYLMSMLLGRDITGKGADFTPPAKVFEYKLNDEKQLDANGDGQPDAAWTFPADTDGDGTEDADVAYSILFTTPPADRTGKLDFSLAAASVKTRASKLETRTGPMSAEDPTGPCNIASSLGVDVLPPVEGGWYQSPNNTSALRKNFQVDAVVVPRQNVARAGGGTKTIATLEFQQDRLAEKGNKWGAWFRNDLEMFSGPPFNWNGAMHTEGSMLWAGLSGTRRTKLFWVSDRGSCLYKDIQASTLSVAERGGFRGEFAATGLTGGFKDFGGGAQVSIDYTVQENLEQKERNFRPDTDSVNASKALDLTLDPLVLYTEDVSQRRGTGKYGDPAWNPNIEDYEYAKRALRQNLPKPYLDDFFRADNRYGPRPSYGRKTEFQLVNLGKKAGDNIAGQEALIRNTNSIEPAEVGADGYWERRAINEGLRVISSQRLKLGSSPDTPTIYPTKAEEFDNTEPHQGLQRRSLRDLLSAVQGTLIFHKGVGQGVQPVAALVSTVHPGSPETLKRSATFEKLPKDSGVAVKDQGPWRGLFDARFGDQKEELAIDFFNGRGTNGWEVDVNRLNQLISANKGSSTVSVSLDATMRKALENLARLGGDPDGAYPPKQEAGKVHPDPQIVQWGNFSNLRRALNNSNSSPADATTQQTAALDLGMLAYNIAYLEAIDYSDAEFRTDVLQKLADRLGKIADNSGDFTVKDAELTAWPKNPANQPVRNNSDRDLGRVDIFRRSPDAPFSVRVYPGSNNLRNPSDLSSDQRYIEAQLASLQKDSAGKTLASPPLLKVPGATPDPAGSPPFAKMTDSEVFPLVPPDAYIMALSDRTNTLKNLGNYPIKSTEWEQWARLIALREQVQRDRTFGFATHFGRVTRTGATGEDTKKHHYSYAIANDLTPSGVTTPGYWFNGRRYEKDKTYEFGCDFSEINGNNFFGFGKPTNTTEELRFLHLAGTLCPVEPKYPALYYLFPRPLSKDYTVHVTGGTKTAVDNIKLNGLGTIAAEVDHTQPKESDPFYGDYAKLYHNPYITAAAGSNFSVLTDDELKAIVIKPRAIDSWTSPIEKNASCPIATAAQLQPNCAVQLEIAVDTDGGKPDAALEQHRVAFKDAAIMDGRERLTTRVMDIDIDMLRQKSYAPSSIGDLWLSFGNIKRREFGGIIYAFREDATREDAIARSPSGGWGGYKNDYKANSSGSRMKIGPGNLQGQDPPISTETGISPKAIDFYADPDRRAHGFRLINGRSVRRIGGGNEAENIYGMSFITDNPLYIRGTFNLHESGGAQIEEFKKLLTADSSNFYQRGSNPERDLDLRFARSGPDDWRPVELLADTVTLLSSDYCDGSLRDTFLSSRPQAAGWYGCSGASNNYTSFYGQRRPSQNKSTVNNGELAQWSNENRFDPNSPIAVYYSGQPIQRENSDPTAATFGSLKPYQDGYEGFAANDSYGTATGGRTIPRALKTRFNAVFVSGISPSRSDQSYGGFHNFVGALENWDQVPMEISGAFVQLNFRNYATGPYDHDAWESNQNPQTGGDLIPYYRPPLRVWGYDVGLQYSPAGPIASRFITLGDTRSEFYGEPASNDPYICLLRKNIPGAETDGCQ
ncbi:MAG: hypothetical protein EA001_13205 [Oscillatoriales cyanobacterium]|nr:MAG: hypothetical protein EA001_13205 [Oscillatoriales cyanobacterium]